MINTENLIKVKDHPNHYRDPRSKAIINIDITSRQNYVNQKTLALKTVGTTERLQEEMGSIKKELSELKDMLSTLISQTKIDK